MRGTGRPLRADVRRIRHSFTPNRSRGSAVSTVAPESISLRTG